MTFLTPREWDKVTAILSKTLASRKFDSFEDVKFADPYPARRTKKLMFGIKRVSFGIKVNCNTATQILPAVLPSDKKKIIWNIFVKCK